MSDPSMMLTPEQLAWLMQIGLGGSSPMTQGIGTANMQAGGLDADSLAGLAGGDKPFPTDAAMLAGLGAGSAGLRAGMQQQLNQRPPGALPVASQPGRGMAVQPFRLPRNG